MHTRTTYDAKGEAITIKVVRFARPETADKWFHRLDKLGYGVERIERQLHFFRPAK